MKAPKPEHPLAGTLLAQACPKDRAFDAAPKRETDLNDDLTRLRGLLYTPTPTQADADELDEVLNGYLPDRCEDGWARELVWGQVAYLGWMRNPCFRLSLTGAAVRLVEAMHDATAQWMEALAWLRRNTDPVSFDKRFSPFFHENHKNIFGSLLHEHDLRAVESASSYPPVYFHRYCFFGRWMLVFGVDGSIALRDPADDKQRRRIAPLDWQHLGCAVAMLRASREGAKVAQESHRKGIATRSTTIRALTAFMEAAVEMVARTAGQARVYSQTGDAHGHDGEFFVRGDVWFNNARRRVALSVETQTLPMRADLVAQIHEGLVIKWRTRMPLDMNALAVEGGVALFLRQLGETLVDSREMPNQEAKP